MTREGEDSFAFLAEQISCLHKDLLAFEEKTERKLREHYGRFDALDWKIDAKIDGLTKALPGIVGNAVREANRERDKRKPR